VRDYPRPPAVVPFAGRAQVIHRGAVIADTRAAIRVLETSRAPMFFIPSADVATDRLAAGTAELYCQWKGVATYWSVFTRGLLVVNTAWTFEAPTPPYDAIRGYFAFSAQLMDECWVDDERAAPNPGPPYGGWITSTIIGPFKGEPGTEHW
jgi:uncharacterized protein (DUF427 family)